MDVWGWVLEVKLLDVTEWRGWLAGRSSPHLRWSTYLRSKLKSLSPSSAMSVDISARSRKRP